MMSGHAYPKDRVVGVILAGGRGRRLGQADKAFVQIAGKPLIEHVLARLIPQCGSLAISANGDTNRFQEFGAPIVSDAISNAGPLAGILAAMDHAAQAAPAMQWILSAPVDCPFLPHDLSQRLYAALGTGDELVLAQSGDRLHFLCGLWSLALRKPLRKFLSDLHNRRAESFARTVGFAICDWSGNPVDPFVNVNTPDDIAMAQKLVLHSRP